MTETIALYTPKETAALLKISERTVRRWIAEGKLPARRYGRQLRIAEESLFALGVSAEPADAGEDLGALAISSFAEDWDNERDATYDDWRSLYGLSEG
jgi:excisionase family DNA binding protein